MTYINAEFEQDSQAFATICDVWYEDEEGAGWVGLPDYIDAIVETYEMERIQTVDDAEAYALYKRAERFLRHMRSFT